MNGAVWCLGLLGLDSMGFGLWNTASSLHAFGYGTDRAGLGINSLYIVRLKGRRLRIEEGSSWQQHYAADAGHIIALMSARNL